MAKRGPVAGHKRDWRNDIVDLEIELEMARSLARLMYSILSQFPTDPSEYDEDLSIENLPAWIHIR